MAGFRYIYAIFTIALLLIFTVHLRNRCDRICNLIITTEAQQNRLKQQLWQKQLQLESYTSPTTIFKSLPKE